MAKSQPNKDQDRNRGRNKPRNPDVEQIREPEHVENSEGFAKEYYNARPWSPHNFHNDPAIVNGVKTNSPPVQTRLKIGKPGDRFEQEADEVAKEVTKGEEKSKADGPAGDAGNDDPSNNTPKTSSTPLVTPKLQLSPGEAQKMALQRSIQPKGKTTGQMVQGFRQRNHSPIQTFIDQEPPATSPQEERTKPALEDLGGADSGDSPPTPNPPPVQTKDGGGEASPGLESQLDSSKGKGKNLDGDTQDFMESRMGGDFGNVRVHDGPEAAEMNDQLGSQAFAHGSDIYFNEGKYAPQTDSGKELIAHELTHTMQQGASPAVQTKADAGAQNTTAGGEKKEGAGAAPVPVTDITTAFKPGQAVKDLLADNHKKWMEIPVKIGKIAQGNIKVRQKTKAKEGTEATFEIKKNQGISLNGIDFLNPLRANGLEPVVALNASDVNNITGVVSVKVKDTVAPDPKQLISQINKNLEPLGLLGIGQLKVPDYTNEVVGGQINLMVNDLRTEVAGYLEAGGSFGLKGGNFVFEIDTAIDIQGLANGEFKIARGEDGKFSGEGTIGMSIANISGELKVIYAAGDVTIQGKVGIESEKFSGELNVMVSDKQTADQTMKAELGVESLEEKSAKPVDPEAKVKKTKKNQVVVGWGRVTARITPWLEGTANIGVDSKGQVTIVGEIAVPDQVELMEQQGKKVNLFELEIKGGYGVPLVGQIGLFASIGMFINAGFGPLILKDVGFKGTYSTDPSVLQNFEITGTLNIGAFAIIGLEAEAGAFITLLGHDIKAGINVTAAAGLRAYAEVTPTFSYEEKASPDGGKVGEAWLKGHFEAAAQLFLALSGSFFVELDSPWWSPAPDERWDYPLGEVEYPIGDSMGIGGDVNWLVGSDDFPEVQFSPVEFDPDKFTSDIMADPPPGKGGGKAGEQKNDGKWDDGSEKGDKKDNPEQKKGGEGLKGQKKKEDISKLTDQERYMRVLGKIGDIGDNAKKKPITKSVLNSKIRKLKSKYGIQKVQLRDEDDGSVKVFVSHKGDDNKKNLIEVRLLSEAERKKMLAEAVKDLQTQEKSKLKKEDQTLTEADAKAIASDVQKKHYVLESLSAKAEGGNWVYFADLGDKVEKVVGAKVGGEEGGDAKEAETKEEKIKVLENAVEEGNKFLKSGDHSEEEQEKGLKKIKEKFKLSEFKVIVDEKKDETKKVHLEAAINPRINGEFIQIDYKAAEEEISWPPINLNTHENAGGHTIQRHLDPTFSRPGFETLTADERKEIFATSRIWNENTTEPRSMWSSKAIAEEIISILITKYRTKIITWLLHQPTTRKIELDYKGSSSNVIGVGFALFDGVIEDFDAYSARIVLKRKPFEGKESFYVLTSFPQI